jgi:hypothetical protein
MYNACVHQSNHPEACKFCNRPLNSALKWRCPSCDKLNSGKDLACSCKMPAPGARLRSINVLEPPIISSSASAAAASSNIDPRMFFSVTSVPIVASQGRSRSSSLPSLGAAPRSRLNPFRERARSLSPHPTSSNQSVEVSSAPVYDLFSPMDASQVGWECIICAYNKNSPSATHCVCGYPFREIDPNILLVFSSSVVASSLQDLFEEQLWEQPAGMCLCGKQNGEAASHCSACRKSLEEKTDLATSYCRHESGDSLVRPSQTMLLASSPQPLEPVSFNPENHPFASQRHSSIVVSTTLASSQPPTQLRINYTNQQKINLLFSNLNQLNKQREWGRETQIQDIPFTFNPLSKKRIKNKIKADDNIRLTMEQELQSLTLSKLSNLYDYGLSGRFSRGEGSNYYIIAIQANLPEDILNFLQNATILELFENKLNLLFSEREAYFKKAIKIAYEALWEYAENILRELSSKLEEISLEKLKTKATIQIIREFDEIRGLRPLEEDPMMQAILEKQKKFERLTYNLSFLTAEKLMFFLNVRNNIEAQFVNSLINDESRKIQLAELFKLPYSYSNIVRNKMSSIQIATYNHYYRDVINENSKAHKTSFSSELSVQSYIPDAFAKNCRNWPIAAIANRYQRNIMLDSSPTSPSIKSLESAVPLPPSAVSPQAKAVLSSPFEAPRPVAPTVLEPDFADNSFSSSPLIRRPFFSAPSGRPNSLPPPPQAVPRKT